MNFIKQQYWLRGYDEAGKAPDAEVAGFDSYHDLLRDLIDQAGEA